MEMRRAFAPDRAVSLVLATMFWCAGAGQGKAAESSDPCSVAEDQRNNLEYDAAQTTLQSWLATHPDDLRALNDLATVLLHREMFLRGVLASHIYGDMGEMFHGGKIPFSPHFQEDLLGVLDKAQAQAEKQLKANPNDAEALYWAGAAHSTRAIFCFTMMKSYIAALRESSEARKDHIQVLKLQPEFADAWLVVGINDYVLGCLPWYYKVVASLAGFHGNRTEGIAEVRRASVQGHWAREDAKLALAVLTRREKLYPETLRVLEGLAQSYPRNFLLLREIAGIHEIQGDLQAAARVYDTLVARREARQPGFTQMPAARILYEAGQIHARLGNSNTALARFEEAGKLPEDDLYVYRAELAAADLCARSNRRPEAIRMYERVAAGLPDSEEGKTARRALKKIGETAQVRTGG
jgi:tetratricopeptide (TPR) repeat protein